MAGRGFVKHLERAGRAALVWLLARVLGVRRRPIEIGLRPKLLVVRLDERVGNLVLVTPLVASLRARLANAHIDLLASSRAAPLVAGHPALSGFLAFDKTALLSRCGPLRTVFALRRRRYDVVIDAANPTDPSTTQAILVCLAGARHTIGFAQGAFGRLYSAPVQAALAGPHEIDMRLALLAPLPGTARVRTTSLAPLPSRAPALASAAGTDPFAILNVGARLDEKRLATPVYTTLAGLIAARCTCFVTYGPGERHLAEAVCRAEPRARLAPPTSLLELAWLMQRARFVVTADTGPMHVAVASGAPTAGIFLTTDPARYGYREPPHAAIDGRHRPPAAVLAEVGAWIAGIVGKAAGDAHRRG